MNPMVRQLLLFGKSTPYPSGAGIGHWELLVETTAISSDYSIDINSGTGLDVNVWWGDGTMDTYTTTGVKSHTYPGAGLYQCKIWGSMTAGNIRQDSTGSFANAVKVKATSAIVGITGWANFRDTFRNTRITTVPEDTFWLHTAVAAEAFHSTFLGCVDLNSILAKLFRYNTAASTEAFRATFFGCTSLVVVFADQFRYNTAVSTQGFYETYFGCTSLETTPADFFRYNTAVSAVGFGRCLRLCVKLQLNADIFGDLAVITDRFTDRVSSFAAFFEIVAAFAGTQGTAPNLWDADYGSVMTIDVQPATAWAANDVITGQTSGATCVVISEVTPTTYRVFKNRGTFALDEIIGVTGDANKLANQGAAHPTFTFVPARLNAFTGHDAASLTNFGDIPNDWKGL